MTVKVKVKDLTRGDDKKYVHEEAIGDKRRHGVAIDEEPPASFRKPGDTFTTMETPIKESNYQGSVLGRAIRSAIRMGPETTIMQGIKGENLMDYDYTHRPADTAKARHRNGNSQKRDAIWLGYLKYIAAF